MMSIRRIANIEVLSSWIVATWSLVLFYPTQYFSLYPNLVKHLPKIITEDVLTVIALLYFIITMVLFETKFWKEVSLIHFSSFAIASCVLLFSDPAGQIGYAYGLIAVFNLLRRIYYLNNDRT